MTLVAGGMALAMLSACHRSNNRNTGMEGTSSVTQVNSDTHTTTWYTPIPQRLSTPTARQ